jgi:DNA-binding MarR family transcriptional regulator
MPRIARTDGLYEPNLLLQFFLTGQPLGRLIECAIAPSGMKANEYAILSAVDELEPVVPSDIARLTSMPRPTLTPYIERLLAAGYVERIPNPRDGRSYMLTLTPEGRRVKVASGRALDIVLWELESRLEGDVDELTSAFGRLREAAEAVLEGQVDSSRA